MTLTKRCSICSCRGNSPGEFTALGPETSCRSTVQDCPEGLFYSWATPCMASSGLWQNRRASELTGILWSCREWVQQVEKNGVRTLQPLCTQWVTYTAEQQGAVGKACYPTVSCSRSRGPAQGMRRKGMHRERICVFTKFVQGGTLLEIAEITVRGRNGTRHCQDFGQRAAWSFLSVISFPLMLNKTWQDDLLNQCKTRLQPSSV